MLQINNDLKPTRTATGIVLIHNNEVLVVTSLKGHGYVLPKGGLEEGLSLTENAIKELQEEAGYTTSDVIPKPIFDNIIEYPDGRAQREVYFLALNPVEVEWEEADIRTRHWWTAGDAIGTLSAIQSGIVFDAFDLYYGEEMDQ